MIKLIVTSIFRRLVKDKYSAALYFILLVVGLSGFGVIITVVNHEADFDRFLDGHERTYRITYSSKVGDQEAKWAIVNGHTATLLEEQMPEVAAATKFLSVWSKQNFEVDNQVFDIEEQEGFYAEPDFFDVLSYPLAQGDPKTALEEPNSIILSEEYALRFFGRTNVMGEFITLKYPEEANNNIELKVTGILKPIPSNSFLQFKYLLSSKTNTQWERYESPRGGSPVYVYFKTHQAAADSVLSKKLYAITEPIYPAFNGTREFPVQGLTKIHNNADNLFEPGTPGNPLFTNILLAVGIVILVISSINFTILYVSKSFARAKEIGVRRTLGSAQSGVVRLIMTESLGISGLSTLLALVVAELSLKTQFIAQLYANDLSMMNNPSSIVYMCSAGLMLGIVSGLYVALKAGRLRTTEIIKGKFQAGKPKLLSGRNLLVVFQFALTAVLLIASFVFLKQLQYVKDKDIGFDRAALVSIARPASMSIPTFNAFKNQLDSEPSIEGVARSHYHFFGIYNAGFLTVMHEGDTLNARGQSNWVDHEFINTVGLELIEGRNFDPNLASDSSAVIINQAALRALGVESALGFTSGYGRYKFHVIGMIKDYHWESFDTEVAPLMMYYNKTWAQNLVVKLNDTNRKETISRMRDHWQELADGAPFEPVYIDSSFNRIIQSETKLSKVIIAYTFISILLACLGLVGIVRHSNLVRQREMGIRKVYGASEKAILTLVASDFFKLMVAAIILGVPHAYFGLKEWLNSFAYHTEQAPWEYIISAAFMIGLTYGVVVLQTIKTAKTNPAQVLKDE